MVYLLICIVMAIITFLLYVKILGGFGDYYSKVGTIMMGLLWPIFLPVYIFMAIRVRYEVWRDKSRRMW